MSLAPHPDATHHRNLGPVLGLVCLACGGEPSQPPAPPPSSYTITGTVADSVTSATIYNMPVILGGSVALTDPWGAYVFRGVRGGTHEVRVTSPEHRPFCAQLAVSADREYHIRLLRLAPAVTGIQVDHTRDRTYITWVDLDGDFPDAAPYLYCDAIGEHGEQLFGGADSAIARDDIDVTTRRYAFPCGESHYESRLPNRIQPFMEDRGGHWVKFECRPMPEWRCWETAYYSASEG